MITSRPLSPPPTPPQSLLTFEPITTVQGSPWQGLAETLAKISAANRSAHRSEEPSGFQPLLASLPAEAPGVVGQAELSPLVGPVQILEASNSCYSLERETPAGLGSGVRSHGGCRGFGVGERSDHRAGQERRGAFPISSPSHV